MATIDFMGAPFIDEESADPEAQKVIAKLI
jgi:hypothetical protein